MLSYMIIRPFYIQKYRYKNGSCTLTYNPGHKTHIYINFVTIHTQSIKTLALLSLWLKFKHKILVW